MQNLFLKKIRLSWYFMFFFVFFVVICLTVNTRNFSSSALALFSVNSFLYGFYIAPILSQQKARVEDLHRIARAESNAIFSMVIRLKKLPPELRNNLQAMFLRYLRSCVKERKPAEGEKQYEELIGFCLSYQGPDEEGINKLLDSLIANQQNRTNFSMQLANKVYSNEWLIMSFLFSITLVFIIMLDTGGEIIFRLLAALLCTGLTMLLVILVKLSTLTHKKAKQVWNPYIKLISSHFYRID